MPSVLILADTHGFLDPRIAELAAGCDFVVHGGDVGNGAVLDRLAAGSGHLVAVRGNNDTAAKWPAAQGTRLAKLPEKASLALPGGLLAIEHGHRALPAKHRHAVLRRRCHKVRGIVYGHSHRLSLDLDALPWVLNPGAAGRARTYGGPSCIILEATTDGWRVEAKRFPSR
jgi:putative phosphoesterase